MCESDSRLRGECRGEGAFRKLRLAIEAQTRGEAPSPGMSAKDALIPTSPRKRGEVCRCVNVAEMSSTSIEFAKPIDYLKMWNTRPR